MLGGYSVFATRNGDVYSFYNNKVNRWLVNATSMAAVMLISSTCQGLFVDMNNTLYCAIYSVHQVVAKQVDDSTNALRVVAGTGCPGTSSSMLYYPCGIFVSLGFTLYVADSSNHRIQRFSQGSRNATTVAGTGAPGTITLLYPRSVVLDGDGYLFIVDSNNNRIIGSGPDGVRCVAGCVNGSGSGSNQLLSPWGMSFDSYGNILVADYSNGRIQKFVLKTNSCGK